ncbi:MAG: hypothetical protein L0387_05500 [Acidobacteria bacterium]|nr:hypothetical protein [Acidobacteriota bacterium]MCI0721225.1 hypothetical protein [Acidobacteriota bacterium]
MNVTAFSVNSQGEIVAHKQQQCSSIEITFASGRSLLLSNFLGANVSVGDEIRFSMAYEGNTPASPELLIKRGAGTYLYQARVGYAAKPRLDKFQHSYVHVDTAGGALGLIGLHVPCAVVRDYFYSADRNREQSSHTFYDVLRTHRAASLRDLRLAYKLRELELLASSTAPAQRSALERAFNILAIPELRSCYDGLLADPKSPVLFPFSGFGLILVSGVPSQDHFLGRRIISFIPERKKRRLKLPLRKLTYYSDRAIYRESRAKLEITFDPILLPIGFEPNWNRWKHLLGVTVNVEAEFVKTGKYYRRGNQWNLATWETALPSRIQTSLPDNLEELLKSAWRTNHRFGC